MNLTVDHRPSDAESAKTPDLVSKTLLLKVSKAFDRCICGCQSQANSSTLQKITHVNIEGFAKELETAAKFPCGDENTSNDVIVSALNIRNAYIFITCHPRWYKISPDRCYLSCVFHTSRQRDSCKNISANRCLSSTQMLILPRVFIFFT